MKINNLTVKKGNKIILQNLSTEFEAGKIHVIMGQNGSGKSTLSYAIAGHPECDVLSGEVSYREHNLLEQDVSQRAKAGVYLAPQYPPVIEGLSHAMFLKECLNIRQEARGKTALDDFEFLKLLRQKAKDFQFDEKNYPRQSLNSGFSGGEKKRNEILQISLLEPDFVILDEIDSGLDIEAMKQIAQFINDYKNENRTLIIITHYPQFAELLDTDYVHVVKAGRVVAKGDTQLVKQIVEHGFGGF